MDTLILAALVVLIFLTLSLRRSLAPKVPLLPKITGSTRKRFEPEGKWKVSLEDAVVASFDVDGYSVAAGDYTASDGVIGSFDVTIYSRCDEVWFEEAQQHTSLSLMVKINADGHDQLEEGVIGGGRLHEKSVEVELNLAPETICDIVGELRSGKPQRIRVDGYRTKIMDDFFKVSYFVLAPCN